MRRRSLGRGCRVLLHEATVFAVEVFYAVNGLLATFLREHFLSVYQGAQRRLLPGSTMAIYP